MKPFIATSFHAAIQYIGSILLISSPWLFGFDNVGGASLFIPEIMGVLLFLIAFFSNNKLGVIKVFPMEMNLFLTMFAGFLLLVGPGLYSFMPKVHWPHWGFGAVFFCLALFTQGSPFTSDKYNHPRIANF